MPTIEEALMIPRVYVAQGMIAGAQTRQTRKPIDDAENTYDWAVTGGSIQGESSGVGLLSVDVMWSSTGNDGDRHRDRLRVAATSPSMWTSWLAPLVN